MALCVRFDMITKMLRCRHGCILERVLVCLSVTSGLPFFARAWIGFLFSGLIYWYQSFSSADGCFCGLSTMCKTWNVIGCFLRELNPSSFMSGKIVYPFVCVCVRDCGIMRVC
jgi:hypothetical protein